MPGLKAGLQTKFERIDHTLTDSELRFWHRRFQADPEVINLSLGETDIAVSDEVKHAIVNAIENDASYYGSTPGYEPLRQKISDYMTEAFQAPVYMADEVLVTVGATEGIFVALQTLFEPGDAVLIPNPAYPLYQNIAKRLGIEVVSIDTQINDFRLTPNVLAAAIQEHENIKGFIFNDPTNPTGVVYSEKEISAFAQILAPTDIIVVTDEIYGALTYTDKHVTLAKYLPEQTVIIGGLSKSHAMPGYRLGFALGPGALIRRMTQVHQLMVGSVPMPLMLGAEVALADDVSVEAGRMKYDTKRRLVIDGLKAVQLNVIEPEGAFYVLVKVPEGWQDVGFVEALASKAKVGVLPGNIFNAPGYIRLSFAGAERELIEAIRRISDFMANINCTK